VENSSLFSIEAGQVAAPAANPASGHEFPSGGGQVTLTCATSGADIFYTAGSGAPDQLYSVPISVTAGTTIKAIAKKSGMTDSNLLTAHYTIGSVITVAMPEADPPSGYEFTSAGGPVTLTCATSGAAIYYTTGSGEPDQLYSVPINVTADTTIKAIAKMGGENSGLLTASYTVVDPNTVAAPSANPPDGSRLISSGTVVLTSATTGATIYYTTGDGVPNQSYLWPISVTANTTIRAQAKKSGMTDSKIVTLNYTVAVAAPTASPANNTRFISSGAVTLTCATSGAAVYYTTGSGEPDQLYSIPISISAATAIRAAAKKEGMADSEIVTFNYTVAAAMPVPSPPSGARFTSSGGTVTLDCATGGTAIYYTFGNNEPDQLYTGPITISSTSTIRALAKKTGISDSDIMSAFYMVQTPAMEFAATMKMGWNLGNTMDGHSGGTPNETAWQSVVTSQALMNGVAAQGFGVVRIPVTWLNKIGPAPNYTIDSAWMNRVGQIVEYCHTAGMKAVINIHHDGADSSYWLSVKPADLTGANKTAIDNKFTAVWRQIAERFKDTGDYLLFEAFNELHDGGWGDGSTAQRNRINELNQIFVNTVRAVGGENANRYLVIPGWVTRPSVTVASLVLPTDTATGRLFVTVHFYDPYDFTLAATQNAWGDKGAPGSYGNEGLVRSTFNSVRDKFVANGIPVVVGEYGAVNRPAGTQFAYQKYYMEYVTKYAVECGFVPILWDNGSSGTGKEKSGMFNRSTGQPSTTQTKEILEVMKKAAYDDYPLSEVTPP
jgi:endoglucanase